MPMMAPPAHAATVTVRVKGFDYPSGLMSIGDRCGAAGYVAPSTLYRSGGQLGSHATGLGFGGSTSSESGVAAHVANPSSLTSISFWTNHPAGPDADSAADGHFFAALDPSAGDFSTFYYGYLPLDVGVSGWGQWSNLANYDIQWYFWNGASSSGPFHTDKNIAELANTLGNGSGARVGFEFGCNGRNYYMDNFRVATTSRTTVYDFEGVPTETYLSSYPRHHSDHLVQDLRKLRLTTGQGHWVAGDSWSRGDGNVGVGWFKGSARLFAKPHGRSTFRRVATRTFTTDEHAWFKIRPAKNTVYRVDTPGTSVFDTSTSKTFAVSVKRRVRMKVADTTLIRGNTIKVSGVVIPGVRGARVALQKKKATGGWTTIDRARTRARGKYVLKKGATSTGKWTLRVASASGKGNLGNNSPKVSVTVKPPPPQPEPYVPPDEEEVVNPVPDTHEQTDEPKPGRVMPRSVQSPTGCWILPGSGVSPTSLWTGVTQRRL